MCQSRAPTCAAATRSRGSLRAGLLARCRRQEFVHMIRYPASSTWQVQPQSLGSSQAPVPANHVPGIESTVSCVSVAEAKVNEVLKDSPYTFEVKVVKESKIVEVI